MSGAYIPSCVVNFRLKFDESLTVNEAPPAESVQDRVEAPSTWGSGKPQTSKPLVLQQGAFSWVMARVPKQCSFEKPGYRQAGKFSLAIDFRELPIDPRTVRAAAVEIHMGTISPEDFAAGYSGRDGRGRRLSVLQTRDEDGGVNASTLRFVGIVDEWEVTHNKSGSEVTMSGRDLRGILLDTPISPDGKNSEQMMDKISWGKDIQQCVESIIALNPFFEDVTVVVNRADWPGGVLPSPGFVGIVPRHRKGARGKKKEASAAPAASSSNLNFWDLIVNCCYLVGGTPYFAGKELVIRPSATVYDKLRGPVDPERNPTPFAGGAARAVDAASGSALSPALRSRRLVYGRDTEKVSINRKYAGWRRPKVICCVGFDPDALEQGRGKVVQGYYPPKPKEAKQPTKAGKAATTRVSPGGAKSMSEVLLIKVPRITSKKRLEEMAEGIFNEIGRGELGGECQTTNLASFGGDNADPDLLSLGPGDGIEFLVDTRAVSSGAPLVATFTDANRRSFEDQVTEILKAIPDKNLARVIVATARGSVAELQRFFRVETVKFAWDSTSGIKIAFDFQNYVVARSQVEDASAAAGSAEGLSTGSAKPGNSGKNLGSMR